MTRNPPCVRVAISGGGMAGATLMNALLQPQHSHLDVHIFESAPAFKEAGIAVGITENAYRALKLIGPSAVECLERAGAVPLNAAHWIQGRGPESGKSIVKLESHAEGQCLNNIVQRADFLRELLSEVPQNRMHTSKKLTRTEQALDGSILLHFSDGTTHECDVLVGADGIRSRVREIVLGQDDPASSPVATPWCYAMVLRPYQEAKDVLGNLVNIDDHVEYGFCGEGTFWLNNILSSGTLVQCAIVVHLEESEPNEWRRDISAEELQQYFASSPDNVKDAVKKLLCTEPKLTTFRMWEHLDAKSYVKDSICLLGDAAHSTTPFQASGAGMSIEDALVLSRLLGHVKTAAEAPSALRAYDQIRRPRTQDIVRSSKVTGEIFTGTSNEFDVNDVDEMTARLGHKWDFIFDIDMKNHVDQAMSSMNSELQKV